MLLVATGPTCPRPDAELLEWAGSDERYEHALRTLHAGKDYLLSVEDYDARYAVRAYVLPTQSPAPAGRRTHAPAGAGRHRKPRRRFGR